MLLSIHIDVPHVQYFCIDYRKLKAVLVEGPITIHIYMKTIKNNQVFRIYKRHEVKQIAKCNCLKR